jgi:hypothetical protein
MAGATIIVPSTRTNEFAAIEDVLGATQRRLNLTIRLAHHAERLCALTSSGELLCRAVHPSRNSWLENLPSRR